MNATAQTPQAIDFDTRVSQYVKLRDKIKDIKDEQKKLLEPYAEALERLGGILLDHLNQVGADSVTGSSGNVHRKLKKSASLADKAAFWAWVVATADFDLLDYKANVVAVKEFIDNNGTPPPGVNYTETYEVGVRRGNEK